jgi:hypothetical protein
MTQGGAYGKRAMFVTYRRLAFFFDKGIQNLVKYYIAHYRTATFTIAKRLSRYSSALQQTAQQ